MAIPPQLLLMLPQIMSMLGGQEQQRQIPLPNVQPPPNLQEPLPRLPDPPSVRPDLLPAQGITGAFGGPGLNAAPQGLLDQLKGQLPGVAQAMGAQFLQQGADRRQRLRDIAAGSKVRYFTPPSGEGFRPQAIDFKGLLGGI